MTPEGLQAGEAASDGATTVRFKERLTITLSPDLVRRLDRTIDREKIRSRSHAIEVLLRKSLRPTVSTAVLLTGGEREDMQLPALAPIGGRPLASLMLDQFVRHGILDLVVVGGARLEEIEALLGDGTRLGMTIQYVHEPEPSGTAGALKRAQPYLAPGPFLVMHGDVLTDIDLSDFIDFHFREKSLATIAVKPRQAEPEFGKVMLQGNKIQRFIETGQDQGIAIINTGVYLFQSEVLDLISGEAPARLETDVFPALSSMGELSAFFFQGIWFDIRDSKNYRLANERWKEKGGPNHGAGQDVTRVVDRSRTL